MPLKRVTQLVETGLDPCISMCCDNTASSTLVGDAGFKKITGVKGLTH